MPPTDLERALRSRSVTPAAVALAVTLAALLSYASVTRLFFAQDDFWWLWRGSRLDLPGLLRVFARAAGGFWWRPLSQEAWFWAHLRLWGPNAVLIHLAGLGAFAMNGALAFAVAWRLTRRLAVAALAGVLYATNPVHFQAVAWPAAFTEIASSFFLLVSFLVYLAYAESGFRRSALLAASLVTFLGALMSREIAVVLPVIVLAHLIVVKGVTRLADLRSARPLALYALVSGLYLLRAVIGGLPGTGPYELAINVTSLENALKYVAWSLGTTTWQLSWFSADPDQTLMPAIGAMAVLSIAAFALQQRSDQRVVRFGAVWFAAFVFPALLVPKQFYPYYASLASFGLMIVLAAVLTRGRRLGATLMLVLLLLAARGVAIGGEYSVNPVPQMGRLARETITAVDRAGGLGGVARLYLVAVPEFDRAAFGSSWMFRFYYRSVKRVSYVPVPEHVPGDAWLKRDVAILQVCDGRVKRLVRPPDLDPALCD